MDELGDGDLARKAQGGDRTAFAVLVERYAQRVRAVCRIRLGPRAGEDDLTQETFLRAFRGLSTLRGAESFGSWLHGIAVRACQEWTRAQARKALDFTATGLTDEQLGHPPRGPSAPGDDRDRVLAAISELSPPLRDVIEGFYFGEETHQEMGQRLGISAAAVNARLHKARALLRQRLAAEDQP